MTGIRHFTAGAIVLDDRDRVLLIHHNRIDQWLYPGGHLEPDEDPAEAALREVREETGIEAEIIGPEPFRHPSVRSIPVPFAIIEMPIPSHRGGPQNHIDFVFVCRPVGGSLHAQLEEVGAARWTPIAELPSLDAVDDLVAIVTAATRWSARYA
ncbi:8-oxo-dGTP pyrophosphatase MutT (NUDIX family) [Allocatelliglobosispora scoriae]|uniref:8-oxo-dGTP pyrophosphatase MutT (NUDIX family) n=1 Tax=Allocatelliglobosispora scoriae TaxID=643052 RepID=A0A841BR59_9ACTN|nr:NUDIX hydrolase [Allocatelliglobosispora scoriae]MBB5869878.1 8-oxo-dGTP pyrophosphatase MutT (NUDIX family) [Allocatelliglobosispora scoriae]